MVAVLVSFFFYGTDSLTAFSCQVYNLFSPILRESRTFSCYPVPMTYIKRKHGGVVLLSVGGNTVDSL